MYISLLDDCILRTRFAFPPNKCVRSTYVVRLNCGASPWSSGDKIIRHAIASNQLNRHNILLYHRLHSILYYLFHNNNFVQQFHKYKYNLQQKWLIGKHCIEIRNHQTNTPQKRWCLSNWTWSPGAGCVCGWDNIRETKQQQNRTEKKVH